MKKSNPAENSSDKKEKRPAASRFPQPRTFLEYVLDAVQANYQNDKIRDPYAPDVLAYLDYRAELAVKQAAFRQFWKEHGLPLTVVPQILPSQKPRNYRTTSKRRVVAFRGSYYLDMGYGKHGNGSSGTSLEAELHGRLFHRLQDLLNMPKNEEAAKFLNFCILRGSYEEAALIFNVSCANGDIVRKLRGMADDLAEHEKGLCSAFMMVDVTQSDYYLEASARTGKDRMFKKFFGPEILVQPLDGKKLFYPPEVFSQVNFSMAEQFATEALSMLAPAKGARVLDLYCGYGLLTMKAAGVADCVFGMDWEGPAIRAAKSNAEHIFPGKNIRFAAAPITGDSLEAELPPAGSRKEYVLLDPPRSGAAAGVAEALAKRKPERIVHIFCGTDGMPHAVKHWGANGYRIESMKILDMFPGSANLETMVALKRG